MHSTVHVSVIVAVLAQGPAVAASHLLLGANSRLGPKLGPLGAPLFLDACQILVREQCYYRVYSDVPMRARKAKLQMHLFIYVSIYVFIYK